MSYLTASEYNTITGRDLTEATDSRIEMASRLLDQRIGIHNRQYEGIYKGYKLDLDDLHDFQKFAVQTWVAFMVAALFLNGDAPNTYQSITLGRFSVSNTSSSSESNIPDRVKYADSFLKDAQLIEHSIRSSRAL